MSECETTLDQLREKRGIAEVVFKKFTEANRYFSSHAFCFYEGDDGKYYNSRVSKYWDSSFIPLVAGKKKEVLRVMRRIQADPLYENVCTMFFIDRDYDEPLAQTNPDLFETPCYSIENLYAQDVVFSRILQSEFSLSVIDPEHQKCLNDFRTRLGEFNQIISKFNAVVKYQHQYAPETICQFSSVKTSRLVQADIKHVAKAPRHDEQINNWVTKLCADNSVLETLEQQLRADPTPSLTLRGKNQLDFVVAIVMSLKALNTSGEYFSRKLEKVYITLTENRLSELSQYAITPPELDIFLKQHKLKAAN